MRFGGFGTTGISGASRARTVLIGDTIGWVPWRLWTSKRSDDSQARKVEGSTIQVRSPFFANLLECKYVPIGLRHCMFPLGMLRAKLERIRQVSLLPGGTIVTMIMWWGEGVAGGAKYETKITLAWLG